LTRESVEESPVSSSARPAPGAPAATVEFRNVTQSTSKDTKAVASTWLKAQGLIK